jgi:hypothetical protein
VREEALRTPSSALLYALCYGPGGPKFESLKGPEIYLFSKTSRPVVGPTEPHIHWTPGVISREYVDQRVVLTTHLLLVLKWSRAIPPLPQVSSCYISKYSNSLRSGRSGDRVQVEAKFSAPVRTGLAATYAVSTGSFPGVKWPGRGVDDPPHPVPRLKQQ